VTTTPGARTDLPVTDLSTEEFWSAARSGRLLIKRCRACGRAHFYPRPFCPHCWSEDVVWEEASGRATVYTWSIVHRNDLFPFSERVPYVAAVVDLDEGPRLMTNIVDTEPSDVRIGMAVEVTFRPLADGLRYPVFRAVRAVRSGP
jgi:uncharacterized OB-fold protein